MITQAAIAARVLGTAFVEIHVVLMMVLGAHVAAASHAGTAAVIVVMVMLFRILVALFVDEEEKTGNDAS